MGHSPQLLEQIAALAAPTYPRDRFQYVFEGSFEARRIFPDIQIFDGSTLVCVVEIGYTRPEKLRLYRERGIRDVRWYGKGGLALDLSQPSDDDVASQWRARRRRQEGNIVERRGKAGRVWVLRWRQDVLQPDGSWKRVQRAETLSDKVPKWQAREMLRKKLRELKGFQPE